MNKKILLVSSIAVFMLLFISFASAINTNNTNTERKESPLYKIRTRLAIGEKISQIFENIKTKFLGERIFLRLPILNPPSGNRNNNQTPHTTSICGYCDTTEPGPKGCAKWNL